MHTEEVWRFVVVDIGRADDHGGAGTIGVSTCTLSRRWRDEHASNAHNPGNLRLGPAVHLQIPDNEYRQQADSQVGDGSANAINVADGDQDVDIDAAPLRSLAIPEVIDGVALKGGEEEE